ncbi:MAG: rhomboid family intramembrane serine protease [Planctomycetota bacterium]|nr:MAG: rhomboid family intramembrane serine protease [Planctomycetota bacterium]
MIPLRDSVPSRRAPVVTIALIASNVAVFLYEATLTPHELQQLLDRFALVPARLSDPAANWLEAYLPLLTSTMLHGGWAHVLGNMWMLWIFGDNVEDRFGRANFLGFYFGCGVLAGLMHCASAPDSPVPTIGASGAVSGVMGAYFLMFPRARVIVLVPVLFYPLLFLLPAASFMVLWFVMQLMGGLVALGAGPEVGGVAWWAHIGGFAAGAAFCLLLGRPGAEQRRLMRERRERWERWLQ